MQLNDMVIQWLTDLTSGEYRQGRHFLVSTSMNGVHGKVYCCLGVYAERNWPEADVVQPGESRLRPYMRMAIDMHIDEERFLAGLNDVGHPFTVIADVIAHSLIEGVRVDTVTNDPKLHGTAAKLLAAHAEYGA